MSVRARERLREARNFTSGARIFPLWSSGEKNAKPHASRRALRALLSTGPGGLITSVPKSSVSDTEGHHWLRVKGGVVSGNSEQKTWNECSFQEGQRERGGPNPDCNQLPFDVMDVARIYDETERGCNACLVRCARGCDVASIEASRERFLFSGRSLVEFRFVNVARM